LISLVGWQERQSFQPIKPVPLIPFPTVLLWNKCRKEIQRELDIHVYILKYRWWWWGNSRTVLSYIKQYLNGLCQFSSLLSRLMSQMEAAITRITPATLINQHRKLTIWLEDQQPLIVPPMLMKSLMVSLAEALTEFATRIWHNMTQWCNGYINASLRSGVQNRGAVHHICTDVVYNYIGLFNITWMKTVVETSCSINRCLRQLLHYNLVCIISITTFQ